MQGRRERRRPLHFKKYPTPAFVLILLEQWNRRSCDKSLSFFSERKQKGGSVLFA